ncbi:MAG: hypothetical protein HY698_07385 [Deltaproteobacteria bacterium]|nr:hypothetical protein [Deltaproteobacteria bacterium]
MAPDPDDAREFALLLARKLSVLPEEAMRRQVLAEACQASPPALVVNALHELITLARMKPSGPLVITLGALARALGENDCFSYEARSALYAAAKELRRDEVARLFFTALPARNDEPEEPSPEHALLPTPTSSTRGAITPCGGLDAYRGKPLTLGERKSLARGGRRELLQRLMRDPDAQVIRVLLENPKLTEKDVVEIACRRPVRGDVLRAVFASRWLLRYEVKRALVLNPYTPTDLAVGLLPTLSRPDLRATLSDPHLPTPVRDEAELILRAGTQDA